MAFSYACLTLQRVVIPALLVLTALFRPVGISFVYLLMFFISPFIPVATKHNFKGSVTAYLIILIALSSILLLCHVALQIITISLQIDTTVFGSCSFTELLLRHVGFIDFHHLKPIAIVEWLVPEVMVFGITLGVYLTIKKLTSGNVPPAGQVESGEADAARESLQNGAEGAVGTAVVTMTVPDSNATTPTKPTNSTEEGPNFDGLIKFSPFFCLATLFFAAVLRPSVPGGFYFLIFLLSGSYWATFQSLQRGFAVVLRFVMVVLALHTLCIVSYQTPWMQQYMDPTSLPCRLLGLEPLATSSCENDIRIIVYNSDYKLDSYLNAIVLLFSYYVLALTTKSLIKPRVSLRREHRPTNIEPTETTPLVRQSTRKSRQTTTSVSGGSALATPRNENEIPMDNLERQMSEDDAPASFMDQISYGFVSVGGFIYQNSYIFTNILMMAWSIVYHSWLTFALLLWANVLWMIPNQRKAMMRSSPFIVLYAELLLVAQYIYGMDLTNDELPSKVDITGINLQQIGLDRPQEHGVQPCVPLIVKTSFLLMFWVTLRQFFKEKMERRSSTLSDMMAPVQLTINAAAAGYDRQDGKKTSKFLKKAGGIIKNLLVRMWIWLLVLVIFLCAITGKQMTGFRICYMALFLFFLLVFQSSSTAWVKIMYGFWLFLIFYAMSILILIYTYQFDKFDQYWLEYLNISQTLQSDIGLERYKTKELFLHLVSPTIIVILTVIQVHYFHRRFIDALQAQQELDGTIRQEPRRKSSIAESKRVSGDVTDPAVLQESLRDLIRIFLKKVKKESKRLVRNFKNVFWLFLELHIMKAVYITAFICSVSEVCVLHIVFAALCVIGVISSTPIQIFISRVISFIVTIIVLTKMIYQIAYLDHSQYDVHCKNNNETGNNAVWFGLEKASAATGGLMGLLKCYIIYMVMVTLHAVVTLRQFQMRSMQGTQNQPRPKVLFPQVIRAHAEKNLKGMIKYLLNYGFYKFGVEISLITLVATITYRQDIVAVLYVIWLCILLAFDRSRLPKLWIVFQYFLVISICVQYLFLVQLPPSLCLSYPWVDQPYADSIQRWALLPGPLHYHHVSKLIFDFILLLIVNRQKRVFWLESNSERNKEVYPGGNNKSIVEDIANLGLVPFENPTRDFLSHIRNYLDIFKNVIICGFYWITLALVFLAGTNISDLLALGYLVGSFVFLWEGSDFYLRPINNIIRRWNWLIYYNVLNMVIKVSLQMAGCLFMDDLGANCCWLVHVLGITCTTSQKNLDIPPDVPYLGEGCPPITTKSYLVWDAICFSFLIMQARIFKSHYFCHIIIDTKANSILASRGAELIEELRQKQIHHRHQHEREVLRKIKRKMEKIRATQQKMLKPLEKPTHFDEQGYPVPGSRVHKRKEIKLHPHAVRAGDYYMFDDMDEKFELDLIEDEVDFLEDQDQLTESEKKMSRRKTLIDEKTEKAERVDKLEKDDQFDEPSTSQQAATLEGSPPETKQKAGSDYAEVDYADKDDEDFNANPIVRLMEAFLVSLTVRLNRFSRNYRYVNKILAEEKKALKESHAIHNRLGRIGAAAMFTIMKKNMDSDENEEAPNVSTQNNTNNLTATATPTTTTTTLQSPDQPQESSLPLPPQQQQQQLHVVDIIEQPLDTIDARRVSATEYVFEEEDFASRDHNIFIEVLISAWYAILSNTDLICYIVVFINQVVNASIISLPLPLMVFLWGTLSLPRPTKTFWVTMIAYTQAIVLIKCIFQYKLIWANYINLPNQPLAPAKIFGVELNPNYASYDLLLLLVLFFHRFILKSQGLWKSEYTEGIMVSMSTDNRSLEGRGEDGDSGNANTNADNAHGSPGTHALLAAGASMLPDQIDMQHSEQPSMDSQSDSSKYIQHLKGNSYFSSLRKFFYNLIHKMRLPADVYALMFLCDFVNFFVLLFGFTAFGSQQTENDSGVQTYLAENKVPIPFLIMLLVQFILIVIDRALYLRKALFYKIIFHFFSVIGIHIWMFFIVPAVTERSFYSLAPPIIFYIIKCFYMLLSSYQIKCGYPKRILGNFLTKGFSMANMISFKFYMQIPFLYELRTILDWVCTDTTMTLFDWLKMEDIFSDIYFIKCSRVMETDFPAMRAQKKALYIKLLMGGSIILLIVISIWGPLCLFALGNAVGQSNVPYEVAVNIRIGPYDPIYATNNRESIFTFNDKYYTDMQNAFIKNKSAITFLSGYDASDIAAVKLAGNSPSLWGISPPDKQRLLDDLKNNVTLTARFTYSLTRIPPSKGLTGTVGAEVTVELNETFSGRNAMVNMLEGQNLTEIVEIPNLIPKFLKVLNSGEIFLVHTMTPIDELYRPLVIKIHAVNNTNDFWWEIRDFCNDSYNLNVLSKLPMANCESGIVMYTFNDKKFPSTFSFLTAGGIIGLYTTFVLLASRFLKSFIAGQNRKIMFEDLPYVDRVLQLCLDIYLVREALEFTLEEDLFAKLIFLYRSPETMIKWTRPKEEIVDDETDTESLRSRRPEHQ